MKALPLAALEIVVPVAEDDWEIPLVGVEKEIITPGDGSNFPNPGDTLRMHYVGTLNSNGKKFDSSRDAGEPFEFQIGEGEVIRGWDEGVMQMSLGEKAKLLMAADYGYGSRGAGDDIPPDADLVFEVELLAINGQEASKPAKRSLSSAAAGGSVAKKPKPSPPPPGLKGAALLKWKMQELKAKKLEATRAKDEQARAASERKKEAVALERAEWEAKGLAASRPPPKFHKKRVP